MLSQRWDQATHGRRKATHHLRDDKQEICLLSFHTIKQQKPAYPCGSSEIRAAWAGRQTALSLKPRAWLALETPLLEPRSCSQAMQGVLRAQDPHASVPCVNFNCGVAQCQ